MHKLSDQEKIFMRKIEESAGRQAALWVIRMRENLIRANEEREDRDRATLPYWQLQRLREEHRFTQNVVFEIRSLLNQVPVPLDEIRRLVEEELSAKVPREPRPTSRSEPPR